MSHRRFPTYVNDADYNTNAPSYYEELARKQGLIKELAERIWGYEATLNLSLEQIAQRFIEWDAKIAGFDGDVNELLQEWISDGTFDNIINESIFASKADQSDLELVKTELIPSSRLKTLTDMDKIQLVNLSNEVKESMTGQTPVTLGLADGIVTPESTTFLEVNRTNLVDKTKMVVGYVSPTGTILPGEVLLSDFIRVDGGETFITNGTYDSGYYDGNKTFVQKFTHDGNFKTVPTGLGIKYVRNAFGGTTRDTPMLTKGTVLPVTYVPYSTYTAYFKNGLELKENTVTIKNTTFFKEARTNYLDLNKMVAGYVNATDGTITTGTTSKTSDYMPVIEGKTYKTQGTFFSGYYNKDKAFVQALSHSGNAFVVPSGVGITFVRVAYSTAQLVGAMFVEGNTLPSVFIPYSNDDAYPIFKNEDTKQKFIQHLALPFNSEMLNLQKINALGDSITTDSYGASYHTVTAQKTGAIVTNYGISGSTIAKMGVETNPMSERYVNMTNTADIITIMGGTNDAGNGVPIGVMADRVNTTFYGACHVLLKGLVEKYSGKKIGVLTPIQRNASATINNTQLKPYVTALKEVANFYSIPVLDLFNSGGITTESDVIKNTYMPDGTHPNAEGHKLIARRYEAFLRTL